MSFWRRPSERLRRFGFASHCGPHSLPCPRTARTGRASRRHLQSICCKSQRGGQNRSRRAERSRRRDRRDSSYSVSRNLGTPSELMTREKRESGPQPSGYPHSRTENPRKIANRKATINRRHPAVLTGSSRADAMPAFPMNGKARNPREVNKKPPKGGSSLASSVEPKLGQAERAGVLAAVGHEAHPHEAEEHHRPS